MLGLEALWSVVALGFFLFGAGFGGLEVDAGVESFVVGAGVGAFW